MKKPLIVVVLLLLLAAVIGGGWWWYQSSQQKALTLYGNVDIRTVNLSFRVGGRLASLSVDEGDAIKAGQTLGELDRAPYENALQQAQANVSTAQAQYDLMMAGYRSEEIAQAAAALVKPGHRIILDSGTTTFEIARMLRQHTDVIAMTNGMNVANALLEAEGVELLMTGGHLRRQSQSFYGDQAEQSLQNYHFDLLFLGVDAIDLDRGVSTHNEDEARLNRKMCEVAERIIVVTDSSKFNRSSLHKIIDTQRIDMIIVDEGIPAESLDGLRKSGIDVVLVSPSP